MSDLPDYRFYEGAHGERYCYGTRRRLACPLWVSTASGTDVLVPAGLVTAAGVAGIDLRRALLRAHDSLGGLVSDDGVHCAACGAALTAVDWEAWIAEPCEPYLEAAQGFLGWQTHVHGAARAFKSKRAAIAWCRAEAEVS